jgi:hypothetical protein
MSALEAGRDSAVRTVLEINPPDGGMPEVHVDSRLGVDGITDEMLAELIGAQIPIETAKIVGGRPVWAEVLVADIPGAIEKKDVINGGLQGWKDYSRRHPRPEMTAEEARDRSSQRIGQGLAFFVVRNSGSIKEVEV